MGRDRAQVGPEHRQAAQQYAKHRYLRPCPRQPRRRTARVRQRRQALHRDW